MRLETPILGRRLTLASLTPDHASATYVSWLNDPEVNRWLETRHTSQTTDKVRAFIEAKNLSMDEALLGIFLNPSGRHIGNIKIGPIRAAHKLAEISLFIGDRESWGMGYASEAIAMVSRYATTELDLRKLTASIYAENTASTKAFRKAGWLQEAVLPRHYLHNGNTSDILIMGYYAV